jgi:hypothetical protein
MYKDAMMASYYGKFRARFLHYLNWREDPVFVSLPLIFSIHQNHGLVRCSWFPPNWCVSALN